MVSPLPWDITDEEGQIIDANGELIAERYRFYHVDDWQFVLKAVNNFWHLQSVLEGLFPATKIVESIPCKKEMFNKESVIFNLREQLANVWPDSGRKQD